MGPNLLKIKDTVVIDLAGAPPGKGRTRFVRATGAAVTPLQTRSYETRLRAAAQVAMNGHLPLNGPLRLYMQVKRPVPLSWSKKKRSAALLGLIPPTSKPDVDNYLKLIDALKGIVFDDDAQVIEASVSKWYDAYPSMHIMIASIDTLEPL